MKFYEKAHQKSNESGKSTLEIGYEKQQKVLAWVYRFGWSSAATLDALVEKKRGYSKKLVEKKLLEKTENEAAWGIKNAPKEFLTLTKLGVEEIERHLEEEQIVGYPRNGFDLIQTQNSKHDLFIQKYLLKEIEKSHDLEFRTAKECKNKSESGVKEPDLILIENHKNISIEIELTIKKGHELDRFIGSAIKALLDNRFDETHIISDSTAIINKYSKILHDINAKVAVWKMKENRNWFKTDKVIESNVSIAERIKFFKINNDGTTTLAKAYKKYEEEKPIIIEEEDEEEVIAVEDDDEEVIAVEDDEDWNPEELLK